jgi:MFS family permease
MVHAPFWAWAISSILLGLGFTFFSGATEAWLVDAMAHAEYKGEMEPVFAKGQAVSGVAMLVGSVAGGFIAQFSNLGVPYVLRAAFLIVDFGIALFFMRDWGFTPEKSVNLGADIKKLFNTSVDEGLRRPAVRWIMLGAPLASGVGFYVFYAMQPHLLALYGDPSAYSIGGLMAALFALTQIVGGFAAPLVRKMFRLRTSALIVGEFLGIGGLLFLGVANDFWLAILIVAAWGLLFSCIGPIRQAYLNSLIPSKQRATVLSFDSLMGSVGGVITQPILGRAADLWGYMQSFLIGGAIQALALPFAFLARRENIKLEAKGALANEESARASS